MAKWQPKTGQRIQEMEVTDIPLDPNKIADVLIQGVEPKAEIGAWEPKTGRRINLPGEGLPGMKREQVPSIGGFATPDTLGGKILAKGPQIAGGTIGGMVGAAIPTVGEEPGLVAGGSALGQWLYAPALAAAGGAAGRATTLRTDDPQYVQKLLFAALEEGGGEYMGRLLSAGLGRLFLRPFRGAVIPGAEAADIALRQAGKRTTVIPGIQPESKTWIGKAKRGIGRRIFKFSQSVKDRPGGAWRLGEEYGAHLLPGQTTESFMDTLQAVAEGSFFGGGSIRRFQTQTHKAALENMQIRLQSTVKRNLIKKVGTKKATAILSDISNADAKAIRAIETGLYQAIDELSDETINIQPLIDLAESFRGKGLRPGAREAMLRQVTRRGKVAEGEIPTQTFSEMKDIKADAWQYWEKFRKAGEMNNARVAKAIALKSDDLMAELAKRKGGTLEVAWRTADEFHKGRLRVEWLGNTLAKYSKAEDVATGKGFINYMAKMSKEINGRPSELSRMGFSSTEIKRLNEFANTIRFASERAVGGGRMLVQIAQGTAIVQLAGAPIAAAGLFAEGKTRTALTGGGVMLLVGPTLLAKTMLSPTGSKLLSRGLKAPAGSRSVGTLGVRLLREVTYHEIERRMKGEPPQLWMRYISPKEKEIKTPSLPELRGFGGRGF